MCPLDASGGPAHDARPRPAGSGPGRDVPDAGWRAAPHSGDGRSCS